MVSATDASSMASMPNRESTDTWRWYNTAPRTEGHESIADVSCGSDVRISLAGEAGGAEGRGATVEKDRELSKAPVPATP